MPKSLFNKVAGLRMQLYQKRTLAQVFSCAVTLLKKALAHLFSCDFCQIFAAFCFTFVKHLFTDHLWPTASVSPYICHNVIV